DDLLARPRLAVDHHGLVGGPDDADEATDFLHGVAYADEGRRVALAAADAGAALERRLPQGRAEGVEVDGLLEKGEGAELHRRDGRFDRPVAREHDDGRPADP